MFFIFGWGRQTLKDYGITFKQLCSNCNNEDYWHLYKATVWFTLFFIPVIPYETRYLLLCPVCEKGIKLQYSQALPLITLAEANSDLMSERISLEEYKERINALDETKTDGELIEGSVEDNNKQNSTFCIDCGKNIEENDNFCQNCGKKLI